MFTLRRSAVVLATLLAAVVMAGCSGDDDDKKKKPGNQVPTPPSVLSTFPAANAAGVAINTNVVARFSEAMLASTINDTNVKVTGPGAAPVSGTVSYDATNKAARFLPATQLASGTAFTATITNGVKDLAGNSMAATFSWNFTTGVTADATPPTVTSTNPLNLATNVPINQVVTAVFSEPMDSVTIVGASFTLETAGNGTVAGSVTCPGTTATFTPSANLAVATTFTARITVEAADLAGNLLAAEFSWSFQTGSTAGTGPAAVVLGTAGNFVILAKTGISTTGTTAVTGNIGLSPAAGSFLTGFSETMDATNAFSTSALVTGQLFAANYAPPTPTNMTTTVLDMQTAYTDAAGRTLPDFTELGAGNLNGLTLSPGLYKWGTTVNIPLAVTISGGPNDIWIFQVAQDLIVGNGAIVTLSGGAQARNIFWQVAGLATFGTTSDFKGIVLCQTSIALNTGASINGRLLAQTAVTLDSNAVTTP